MNLKRGYNQYLEADIMTSNGSNLIIMMYDAVIKMLEDATQVSELTERTALLNKSHKVIAELIAALNFEQGKDVAKSLYLFYMEINRLIMNVNMAGMAADLDEIRKAIAHLGNVRSGWEESIEKNKILK